MLDNNERFKSVSKLVNHLSYNTQKTQDVSPFLEDDQKVSKTSSPVFFYALCMGAEVAITNACHTCNL